MCLSLLPCKFEAWQRLADLSCLRLSQKALSMAARSAVDKAQGGQQSHEERHTFGSIGLATQHDTHIYIALV